MWLTQTSILDDVFISLGIMRTEAFITSVKLFSAICLLMSLSCYASIYVMENTCRRLHIFLLVISNVKFRKV